MPRDLADKIIMFSVIGLVAWAIIGLPMIQQARPYYYDLLAKAEGQNSQTSESQEKSINEKNNPERKDESQRHSYFLEHASDWLVAIFTGLLVYVTYRLVISTNRLWEEARDTANRQERTTKTLERAYLHVLPQGIDVTVQGAVLGQIVICNAGHLPARKVSNDARIVWSDDRSLSDFEEADIPIRHTNVLPAGGQMPKGTGALNAGRTVLAAGQGFVYVFGRVTYEDGFGELRWLTFCHRYNCSSPKLKNGGIDSKYARHHHYYNDGD
jgi:hypothetical protein